MIIQVPLDQVLFNPYQRRQDFGDIPALAADIQAHGLLQPPIGRLQFHHGGQITGKALAETMSIIRDDGFLAGLRVQLAFGHRRLRACRHAGLITMPVNVIEISDEQMLDWVWSENSYRVDVNPIEQAELIAEKLERARAVGGTQQTVADAWGLARSTIANKLRLLKLPNDVQAAVRAGTVSERQALALLMGENGNGEDDQPLVAAVLSSPGAISSDGVRTWKRNSTEYRPQLLRSTGTKRAGDEKRGPQRFPAAVAEGRPVPMLTHSGAYHSDRIWPALERGARKACARCIDIVGPPIATVCRECPAVTLVTALIKEAPAP